MLLGLCIVLTRVPFLHGDAAVLDGDECVLGLMSKHLSEGRELPFWFYGQRYGFSLIEVGCGAAAFRLFGVCDESLKGAMLAIWLLGLLPAVLLVRRIHGSKAACLAAALLALCPAWVLWSLKARGGYLTAWAITNGIIFLVWPTPLSRKHEAPRFFCAGLGMTAIFAAQPLWLPGAIVFILMALRAVQRRRLASALIAGLILGGMVFGSARLLAASHQWEADLFSSPDALTALIRLPYRVWVMLSGAHAYTVAFPPGVCTQVAAWGWSAMLVLAIILAWKRDAKVDVRAVPAGRSADGPRLRRACAWSMAATLLMTAFVNEQWFAYRYLLPLAGYLCMFAASFATDAWSGKRGARAAVVTILTVLLMSSAGALWELRSVARVAVISGGMTTTRPEIEQLIKTLETRGLTHVYALNPLVQWHIMFESQERIVARWKEPVDRVPRYPRAVDEALRGGDPTALIGDHCSVEEFNALLKRSGYAGDLSEPATTSFFMMPNPSEMLLRSLGFAFDRPQAASEDPRRIPMPHA